MARSVADIHPYYFSLTKRVFDVLVSSLLILLLSPFLVGIVLLLFFTIGWPVIFHQKRYGQHKKIFTIYKFRVMEVGAEKQQWRYRKQNQAPEPMYKNWNDPRFVGVGKWLSKTGLDELPQLINILKGEMSFVGPRPLPLTEADKLPASWDFRYTVKPGVFSEWSAHIHQKQSLKSWLALEQNTLENSGLAQELNYIGRTLSKIWL